MFPYTYLRTYHYCDFNIIYNGSSSIETVTNWAESLENPTCKCAETARRAELQSRKVINYSYFKTF